MLALVAGQCCCGEVVLSRRWVPVLGTFLIVVTNDLTLRDEGFIWTHSLMAYSPSWWWMARQWQECVAETLTSDLGGTRNRTDWKSTRAIKTLVPNLNNLFTQERRQLLKV